jgi:hypothetical protein
MKTKPTVGPQEPTRALDAERNRKMAAPAHAYVRGSTTRLYQWLGSGFMSCPPPVPSRQSR